MKKIILAIILLAFPLICHAQDFTNQTKPNNEEQPLRLTIKSDKETYVVGGKIKIICIIENVSDKTVSFYRDRLGTSCYPLMKNKYTDTWCRTNCYWKMCEDDSSKQITLKPHQQFKYFFDGKISIRQEGFRFGKGFKKTKVSGLIIDFDLTSKYLEYGFGEYYIYTLYRTEPYQLFEKKPKNPLSGVLKSNTITIKVEGKTGWEHNG